MSEFDIISDFSKSKLYFVPENVLAMFNLKMLYLEGNLIEYLPDDFFTRLTKLNWLDLRNNKLRAIPTTIAHHENMENLLLSGNYLERLPNELGLVPKLKVLQVSQNPLIYPCRSIITDGLQTICAYLRCQYLKENATKEPTEDALLQVDAGCLNTERSSETATSDSTTDNEYRHQYTSTEPVASISVTSSVKPKKVRSKHRTEAAPIITVTSLSKPSRSDSSTGRPDRIVHEIERGASRISLKSYYSSNPQYPELLLTHEDQSISEAQLKEYWLGKIKEVLIEQERILQQEKNLMALKDWRTEKRCEPMRKFSTGDMPKPPYDVQEEYMRIMSREDIRREIDNVIRTMPTTPPKTMNIEKLINELVGQLKDMENMYKEVRSPRSEIEQAGNQIKLIMNLHEKLLHLQSANDTSLQ